MSGGFPAPESFPIQILKELSQSVFDKFSAHALQYGLSEGFPPLREILANRVSGKNIRASAEDVIITSGSQGNLDSVAKILAPGLRIGFCIAPAEIKKWLVLAKQGVDLHASSFELSEIIQARIGRRH
jgi:2-aminoadipate transaminase